MCLPLMPERFIEAAYEVIKEEANRLFVNQPKILTIFENFYRYFAKFWLLNITPSQMTVFGSFARTNNHSEGFNKLLNRRMGIKHLNIWDFCGELKLTLSKNKFSLKFCIFFLTIFREAL